MSFVSRNSHLKLHFQLSEADLQDCELHHWPDVDQGGDHDSSKSTSGMWLSIMSKDGQRQWPLAWSSKKQTTSNSTCEAETISLAVNLQKEVIPLWLLLGQLLDRPMRLRTFEDNSATIIAIQKGFSASLRHLPRTQRLSVGFAHEFFHGHEDTAEDVDGFSVAKPDLADPLP